MFDILAPFHSTYLPFYRVIFNIIWLLGLGAATAFVVIGIPRIIFLIFQKAKIRSDIKALAEEMAEDSDSQSEEATL